MVDKIAVRNYGITAAGGIALGVLGTLLATKYIPQWERERARRQAEIQAEVLAERLGLQYVKTADAGNGQKTNPTGYEILTQIQNSVTGIRTDMDKMKTRLDEMEKYKVD